MFTRILLSEKCRMQHLRFSITFLLYTNELQVGFFEDYTTPEYVTCLDFNEDGRVVTGDSNGNVHIWDAQMHRTISTVPTNHAGSIISIRALSNFHVVTGGGADRKLNLINLIESVPCQAEFELPEHLGGIVAMVPLFDGFSGGEKNFDFLRMVLGTSNNSILAGSMTEAFDCIVKGCLLYTSPSPRDKRQSRMPSSA